MDNAESFPVKDSDYTDFKLIAGLLYTLPAYVALLAIVMFLLYISARRWRRIPKNLGIKVGRQIKNF